ncbi:uncharacterized protein M421DRAFT_421255 [Didymella exigua CBS 183.55]|uniref:SGNH hydrolase n=1 Tax=Didymella exigua CBS 183.55 TaxID=1150837 RepID=A0A6A5RLT7_9PLEO|nr:uncharacterized protein M421DRAFT_421255 [Didymella exigua CBS 183.55]KAF1928068.1 hypothetical protein M421DRAFT_421255 [Didymella exigua CBS 183.55]
MTANLSKINRSRFYFEWKGHQIQDLTSFHAITTTQRPDKPIVYLAGDSSLDNKYWVSNDQGLDVEVPDIYNHALDKPTPKPDVSFWMNHFLGVRATCVNTAVEESMLRQRDEELLPHDKFIRDTIRSEDVLIVSVGANDIALKPLPCTILHMLQLAWITPRSSLEKGTASSLKYFNKMFCDKVQGYVDRMTAKTRPRAVIICMIYFPLESGHGQSSWADMQLKALGYNTWPEQLQTAIVTLYKTATQNIKIQGTEVVPCALNEVLDGKLAEDYTARVEPNEEGGRKMAQKFVELLKTIWPEFLTEDQIPIE